MKSARVRSTRRNQDDSGRLRPSCKIRPGTQRLTNAAMREVNGAQKMYDDAVARDVPFSKIQADLQKLAPDYKKRMLVPTNTEYFRMMESDFPDPRFVQQILDKYGEQRQGDTEKRLYTIPVAFPSDNPDIFFEEDFRAYKASGLFRWSAAPTPDADLQCMGYKDDAPADAKRRLFGTREQVSFKPCEPNKCDLFGSGQCKHHGRLLFFIPDVDCGLCEIRFTSVYASADIIETSDQVRESLGKIAGTLDGMMLSGEPIFYLTKSLEQVRMRNPGPKETAVKSQQVITLVPNWAGIRRVELERNRGRLSGPQQDTAPSTGLVVVDGGAAPASDATTQPQPETLSSVAGQDVVIRNLRAQRTKLAEQIGYTISELKEFLESKGFTSEDGKDPDRLAEQVHMLQNIINRTRKSEAEKALEDAAATLEAVAAATDALSEDVQGQVAGDTMDAEPGKDQEPKPLEGELFNEENPF